MSCGQSTLLDPHGESRWPIGWVCGALSLLKGRLVMCEQRFRCISCHAFTERGLGWRVHILWPEWDGEQLRQRPRQESSSDHFVDDDRGLHACWDSILITLCGTTSSSWKLLCRCELTQTELPKPQAHLGSQQRPAVAYSLGRPRSFTQLCLANTFSHVLGCEKNKLKINSVEIWGTFKWRCPVLPWFLPGTWSISMVSETECGRTFFPVAAPPFPNLAFQPLLL